LSRNCSDWYPLLDLCSYKDCLIADVDGLYDPATANGRLLLGVKGTLSEWELHTIRARMTAGLLNKAARGQGHAVLAERLTRGVSGAIKRFDPREGSPLGDTLTRAKTLLWSESDGSTTASFHRGLSRDP